MHNRFSFQISPCLVDIGVICECFAIRGLANRESDPEFEFIKKRELHEILNSFKADMITSDPIIQGFRQLHWLKGCANRRTIPASEKLLKFVTQTGDIPHVNLLVDIYNLISAKTHLSLGAHNMDNISGNVTLRPTDGTEHFRPIGSPEQKTTKNTEYAYVDDANDVICRLEVRQVEKTKVTLDICNCFYIIQGNMATSPDYSAGAHQAYHPVLRRQGGNSPQSIGFGSKSKHYY